MLGGQLTCLVFHWDWQALNFLELFPSLRKLEMICGEASRPTLKLPKSLSALSALQHLVLNGLPVKDLGPLGGCSQTLQYLDLGRCPVEDLAPLAACSQLQHLDLGGCLVEDLQPLAHCTALRILKLSGISTLRDLGPLGACASLQHLDLGGCRGVTSLEPLLELHTSLLYLDISSSHASDFQVLSSCTGLQHLILFCCVNLHSLAPLASCHKLQHLDIISLNVFSSLEPIWGLQELQHLNLWGAHTTRRPIDRPTLPELGPLTRVENLNFNMPSFMF